MVMADDENSDLAANATEQKVTRNRRKFALRISRSRIEKDRGLSAAQRQLDPGLSHGFNLSPKASTGWRVSSS
jgi:hypothetical protein